VSDDLEQLPVWCPMCSGDQRRDVRHLALVGLDPVRFRWVDENPHANGTAHLVERLVVDDWSPAAVDEAIAVMRRDASSGT
jgi:hypothetical protein